MAWQGVLGILCFFLFAWLISENRKRVNFKHVALGIGLQVVLAACITRIPAIQSSFLVIESGVRALKEATMAGTSFVWGYVGGAPAPFELKQGASTFIFAFQALPMIMVIGALSMLLFYWRVLPLIVKTFSWVLQRTLNIGGALGVAAAAKVFLGQAEAPMLIHPYLKNFSRSELFTIMTLGMATTSGAVMALYSSILENTIPHPIVHILTASIISIPAAITLSRIMIPQVEESTSGELVSPYQFSGWMDAVYKGTSDGLQMFLNIIAMLVVMIALVALTNKALGTLPLLYGHAISLELLFGYAMSPLTWLMGIPWSEAHTAGYLLASKTVLNEVVAFLQLASLPAGQLSVKSNLIMTYALCGFANFSSIGILVGGIGTLVPSRRSEVVNLGLKCVLSGTLSTCLSGTIIGLLY